MVASAKPGRGKGKRKASTPKPDAARSTGRPQRLGHLVPGHERHAAVHLPEALRALPPRSENPPTSKNGPPGLGPDILCLPNPEWLPHVLTVTGPCEEVADFRRAAAGPGVIPWVVDYHRLTEDWLNGLLTPPPFERGISVEGARILARQLRDVVELQDVMSAGAAFGAMHCPIDLHALVPVPTRLLRLGPDDPTAISWLWEHWGTTWPLRGVEELEDERLPSASADADRVGCRFWSADWAPWRLLSAVRDRWPDLVFSIRIQETVE